MRNVELCLRNLSKLAFTSSSYHGPCFGQPPKAAVARNSQRNLPRAAISAPRTVNSSAGAERLVGVTPNVSINDSERQEVARLRRELEQQETQLKAQAQEIRSLRTQLEQQQHHHRNSSALDFDFSLDDSLERLIMSEPGKTPRPGGGRPNHSGQTEVRSLAALTHF